MTHEHTPGTMTQHWDGEGGASVGCGGYIRADMVGPLDDRKPNARRIAACWNACEGIPTDALEGRVVADMLEALRKAEAGLSDIGDAEREDGDDLAWCEVRAAKALPDTRAAIARATGGAA